MTSSVTDGWAGFGASAAGAAAHGLDAAVRTADALGWWFAAVDAGGSPLALAGAARLDAPAAPGRRVRLRHLLRSLTGARGGQAALAAALGAVLALGERRTVQLPSGATGREVTIAPAPWPGGGAVLSTLPLEPLAGALARAERRAVELQAELFLRSRELARSEDKYRELFDASPDLYIVVDGRGRIAEVNRTALRATGYRHEELLGRRAPRLVAPEARRRLWAALPAFVESGRVENLELTVRRRDGSPIEAIVNAAAVRDEQGRLAGAHAVIRDITSRLALQRQLLQADRLVATGRLAAGVAHEINNPLQAIMLHLALIAGALPDDFTERDAFERVREGVRRIRQIVAALLDLHRGGDQLLQPVDVHGVLEEALGLAQTPLRHGGVRVQRDLASELPRVWAVERHVYQVLLNLILNALDAMRDGGQLTVRTRFLLAAGEIEIDIGDTGPGIPENLLPQIFDPFFTGGDRSRTGLGLFVTYGLVRQHGGRLQVDSQPGRGTTFRVFFPAMDEAGAEDRGPSIELQSGDVPL